MALSLLHLLFLRFIEPMCERGELAVALIGEVCDAGVFVCGLILILGDSANDKFRSEGCRVTVPVHVCSDLTGGVSTMCRRLYAASKAVTALQAHACCVLQHHVRHHSLKAD